jgi:hypothetical protein
MFTPQIIGKRFFRTKPLPQNSTTIYPYLLTVLDKACDGGYYYHGASDPYFSNEDKKMISQRELFSEYNSIRPNYCINIISSSSTKLESASTNGVTSKEYKPSVIIFVDQILPKRELFSLNRPCSDLIRRAYLLVDDKVKELDMRSVVTDNFGTTMVVPNANMGYNQDYLCIIYMEDKSTYFRLYGYINSTPLDLISYILMNHMNDIEPYVDPQKFIKQGMKVVNNINNIFGITSIHNCEYNVSEDLQQTSSFLSHFNRFNHDQFRSLTHIDKSDKIDSVEKLIHMIVDPHTSSRNRYELKDCFFVRYSDFINVSELIEKTVANGFSIKFLRFRNADLAMVYKLEEVADDMPRLLMYTHRPWEQAIDNDGSLSYEEICTLFAHKHN